MTESLCYIHYYHLSVIYAGVCTRHSAGSEVSCDYANPPENVTMSSDSDTSEPEQKLLKYEDSKHVSYLL